MFRIYTYFIYFHPERKFDERSDDEYPDRIEQIEEWSLRDVIFVEEVRNVPIGRVLKVDGAYALVHFSPDCNNEQVVNKTSVKSLLNESRLLRKDELQVSIIKANVWNIKTILVNFYPAFYAYCTILHSTAF